MRVEKDLNEIIAARKALGELDTKQISDTYHTFGELYEHRTELFIALCAIWENGCWKSRLHSDGTMFDGMFIMGLNNSHGEQITYHLHLDKWDETSFAHELDKAPEYDGHTPNDVLTRLKRF